MQPIFNNHHHVIIDYHRRWSLQHWCKLVFQHFSNPNLIISWNIHSCFITLSFIWKSPCSQKDNAVYEHVYGSCELWRSLCSEEWSPDKAVIKYGCVVVCRSHLLSWCLMIFWRYLPREVDPLVYNMSHEDPGNVSYSEIGGLSEQIRELREVQ